MVCIFSTFLGTIIKKLNFIYTENSKKTNKNQNKYWEGGVKVNISIRGGVILKYFRRIPLLWFTQV